MIVRRKLFNDYDIKVVVDLMFPSKSLCGDFGDGFGYACEYKP